MHACVAILTSQSYGVVALVQFMGARDKATFLQCASS